MPSTPKDAYMGKYGGLEKRHRSLIHVFRDSCYTLCAVFRCYVPLGVITYLDIVHQKKVQHVLHFPMKHGIMIT